MVSTSLFTTSAVVFRLISHSLVAMRLVRFLFFLFNVAILPWPKARTQWEVNGNAKLRGVSHHYPGTQMNAHLHHALTHMRKHTHMEGIWTCLINL